MSRIIFLNGCSSSGKTSISKAIQEISSSPWLHMGVDTFIGMLPSKFFGFGERSKEGYFSFNTFDNEKASRYEADQEFLAFSGVWQT